MVNERFKAVKSELRSRLANGGKWPMRVLLIEDEPTTAKSIDLMLSTEGFNVYTTDLGEEGLDLGKLYDYDIILLDLNLPDMSGYEVLRTLRVAKVKRNDLHASFTPRPRSSLLCRRSSENL